MNILLIADRDEHHSKFKGLLELALPKSNIVDKNINTDPFHLFQNGSDHWSFVLFLPTGSDLKRNELLQICENKKLHVMCIVNEISKDETVSLLGRGVKSLIGFDAPMDVLRNGIKFVREGGIYLDPKISKEINLKSALKDAQQEEFPTFTKRQWEVFRLVAKGCTKDEIAAELTLKPSTVQNHMKKITLITNSKTLAGAVSKGHFNGWLKNI